MKISLVAVSVIIALQATSLLMGAEQRYIYHNSIHQCTHHSIQIPSLLDLSYHHLLPRLPAATASTWTRN